MWSNLIARHVEITDFMNLHKVVARNRQIDKLADGGLNCTYVYKSISTL